MLRPLLVIRDALLLKISKRRDFSLFGNFAFSFL